MKKYAKVLMLAAGISLFGVASSQAQIVVRARIGRPAGAVVVRPERPSPRHVWVSEEYVPQGATYVYKPGYWAERPHPGAVWRGGHWRHARGGYVWIAGHWR